ncbi:MAG TPA: 50S ribosomal protein L22 [archaeon]|jgi:large subunit ribosomal protein L22|nr:50S ribosomal protein L22 [archaeon]HPC10175.1 50S ribosomal protein L22 [archaeon]HRT02358.1 50S ribosomal protein L22 [Candidatus Diapherotrites archaeon]
MAKINYNFQKKVDPKKTAKASRRNARVSTKMAIEFSNYFKNKKLNSALIILDDIIAKKDFLPLVKYRKKVAHRKGQAKRGVPSGRYPVKTAKEIKQLLLNARANAEEKNLDIERLKILHMYANKGVTRSKLQPLGRIGGKTRESKSTNLEVILVEE